MYVCCIVFCSVLCPPWGSCAQLFSALHQAYVNATSNPFAPIGPVRESHASTIGAYLERSPSFARDVDDAVQRAAATLEYRPLATPQTAMPTAQTGRVSAAHAAYANARDA